MDCNSYEFKRNSGSDDHLNWIIAFESENVGGSKENDGKRNEAEDYFHSLKYLLSQKGDFNIVLELGIEPEIG